MAPYGAVVAVVLVEHVGAVEEGRRPSHLVVVESPVAGRYRREASLGAARVLDILQPLVIYHGILEDVGLAVRARGAVAEPAQALVALRAVGRHAAVVAAYAPVGVAVDAVEQRYRALERARRGHGVVDDVARHVVCRGCIVQTVDLHIAETVVGECRMPLEGSVAGRCVDVSGTGRTQVGRVERRVGVENLRKAHRHGFAGAAVEADTEPAHHVLSHVDDDLAVGAGRDAQRLDLILYGDIGVGLCVELASRILHAVGLFPCRVVVLRGAPSRQFEAGVVLLAVELVVGDDGAARGDAPRGIAHDGLGGAVGILDLEPRKQRRQPEVHETARTHGEVASVAEHHAQYVVALVEHVGYVIDVVIYACRVERRGG